MRGITSLGYSQVLIILVRPFQEFSKIIIHVKFHKFVFKVLKSLLSLKNSTASLRIQLSTLSTDTRVLSGIKNMCINK